MSPYEGRHAAHKGTLGDHIDHLAREFPEVPTLFFIDPFGLEPLRAEVVRRALAGPKNEVFLLFADQAALRHLGAADAFAESGSSSDEPLDLFGGTQPASRPAPSRALEITAQRATEIMDAAFGGFDWRKASRAPHPRQAFVDLYCDLLRSFGAARVLALPIYDRTNAPKYHLIYGTKSGRGYEVMKDAIERGWKAGLVGSRAVEMMRLGTQISDARLLQLVKDHFAGWNDIPWSSDNSQDKTVRRFALEDTSAMPSQMSALRQALAPYRVRGRKDYRYNFPPRR